MPASVILFSQPLEAVAEGAGEEGGFGAVGEHAVAALEPAAAGGEIGDHAAGDFAGGTGGGGDAVEGGEVVGVIELVGEPHGDGEVAVADPGDIDAVDGEVLFDALDALDGLDLEEEERLGVGAGHGGGDVGGAAAAVVVVGDAEGGAAAAGGGIARPGEDLAR